MNKQKLLQEFAYYLDQTEKHGQVHIGCLTVEKKWLDNLDESAKFKAGISPSSEVRTGDLDSAIMFCALIMVSILKGMENKPHQVHLSQYPKSNPFKTDN